MQADEKEMILSVCRSKKEEDLMKAVSTRHCYPAQNVSRPLTIEKKRNRLETVRKARDEMAGSCKKSYVIPDFRWYGISGREMILSHIDFEVRGK